LLAQLLVRVVDCDWDVLGAAGAPPEGAADVVEEGAGAWPDVAAEVVGVEVVGVEVVIDGVVDGEEVAVPAEAAVCVVARDVVLDAWPPQPAATTISVSAARAPVSFEIMRVSFPGTPKPSRRCPWESRARTEATVGPRALRARE
jgi:hypothetical protein